MEWKSLTTAAGTTKYYKYSECSDGDLLVEGIYNGPFEGRYGTQHEFLNDPTHGRVVLNGCGFLDYLLNKSVQIGDRCRIVYRGKVVLTKGKFTGKDSHQFDVQTAVGSDTQPKGDPAKPKTSSAPWDLDKGIT